VCKYKLVCFKIQEGTLKILTYLKVIIADNQQVMNKINILKNELDIENCPVRKVLDRFGDKWSLLVLLILGKKETLRFNAINKEIGPDISQKMLTVTLRTLEADGFLTRTIYPEVPPRVEYTITDLGKSLVPLIDNLEQWAKLNMAEIEKSRGKFAKS
jgi:DNA-binding HxlR family transcriptional regulator